MIGSVLLCVALLSAARADEISLDDEQPVEWEVAEMEPELSMNIAVKEVPVTLGSTVVTIVQETYTNAQPDFDDCATRQPLRFINLHANEHTSVAAARAVLKQEPCGGVIVRIKQRSRRVKFTLNNKEYSFDPNRIFTETGRVRTLGGYKGEPEKAVAHFADQLLNLYGWADTQSVIALHNTRGSYGANSYLPNAAYASEAKEALIQGGSSTFLFLTKQSTFDCFKNSKLLVSLILQVPTDGDQIAPENDGSLSLKAELDNKDYINTETLHGVLYDQMVVLYTAINVCLYNRETLAPPQLRIDESKTYCRETGQGRTGVCMSEDDCEEGVARTNQVGCSAGQVCCVAGGCMVVDRSPFAPGRCIDKSRCSAGNAFPSNGGRTAVGCGRDPGSVYCCLDPLPELDGTISQSARFRDNTSSAPTHIVNSLCLALALLLFAQ